MRLRIVSLGFAVLLGLAPLAAGFSSALAQDFSITNQIEPANPGRRDVMRQLQAWWDVHAYYPRHASQGDEDGTVRVHLVIYADGRIWAVSVVGGSGSASIDAAGVATFRGGFIRPFPEGSPGTELDIPLHYVLAHRHDQAMAVSSAPVSARAPFTITNAPVKSPILETMLQRTCTGTVVKEGIRNHPAYGVRYSAQAIFFRRADGSSWVNFYEGGYPILAPVSEVGKIVQWTGREEHIKNGVSRYYEYTVWPDGDNKLSGSLFGTYAGIQQGINNGGTVDLTCAAELVPAVTWSSISVTPGQAPIGDPP